MELFINELRLQSHINPNLFNQIINLHLVENVLTFEPDFYIRLLMDNLRWVCDNKQFSFVLTNSSTSPNFFKDVQVYLKAFSTKLKNKKAKAKMPFEPVIPKKRLKSKKKQEEDKEQFTIKKSEPPRMLDEFWEEIALVFQSTLLKMSLNFRKQQINLGKTMYECAYYMSKGGKFDSKHLNGNSVLGSLGYYIVMENCLSYLETRTSFRNYNLSETVYYFPLFINVHKFKKNHFSLSLKNLPDMMHMYFYNKDLRGQMELRKLGEYHRLKYYYLGLQEFFVQYYQALSMVVRYLFANQLLPLPEGLSQFERTYNARSKYFNRTFLLKMPSFEEQMASIDEAKKFREGRLTRSRFSGNVQRGEDACEGCHRRARVSHPRWAFAFARLVARFG